jgi:2,5-dihydroxypyridine 5,6-dioxygenase
MVNTAPIENRGGGVLVVAPGDMILWRPPIYVREPVYMEIKDGCITGIKGGLEAELLNRWFTKWDDPRAYSFSHVGWGCNRHADWMHPGQDNEAFYANILIAFGSNVGIYPGAQTMCPSHIDFACLNTAYWVDDTKIMENGEFVIDALKYQGEEEW